MNSVVQDVRLALRMLVKQPAFSLAILACLALGTGANTAVFSVVNAVVLRPLALEAPEQLVVLQAERRPPNFGVALQGVDLPNFRDWQKQGDLFAGFGAFTPAEYTLTEAGQPVRLTAGLATADFFTTLHVEPALGRLLTPEDVDGKNGHVVVLSDALWRGRFGANPGLIGETILLDQEGYTVVGILPPHFGFPYEVKNAQLWTPVPAQTQIYGSRGNAMLFAIGRLKPGVTLAQAQTQFNGIAARQEQEYPDVNKGYSVQVIGLQDMLTGGSRRALWMLLGAVGLVLSIACGNVASLCLARGLGRRRELAIRAALGAGRFRIMRQLLTESMVLGLLGGLLGCLLAYWSLDTLKTLLPGDLPRIDDIAVDGRVLAFALGVAVLTGLLFGLPAALGSVRVDLHGQLKSGTREVGVAARGRLQSVLVVGEIAVATTLLIGAGLLIRSFRTVAGVHPGYVTENVLTFQMDVSATTPFAQRADFFDGICEHLRALPAVRSVCVSNGLPLTDKGLRTSAMIVDQPNPKTATIPFTVMRAASPNYFATLGIPLLRGRLFDDGDARGKVGVMVIDETLARECWPTEDPIGKRLRPGAVIGQQRDYEIIGVVGKVRDDGLDVDVRPNIYVPYRQYPDSLVLLTLRTDGDPLALVSDVRRTLAALAPHDAPFAFATMQQYVSKSVAQRRYPMLLLGLFAALALALAALGIYGVLAFSVAQRTHELGVRLALGARAAQVLRLVLWQGLRLALVGVGLGLVGAFAGTRLLRTWLFGIQATDAPTFAGAAALFVGIALVACFVPARRATRVDPLVALRCE